MAKVRDFRKGGSGPVEDFPLVEIKVGQVVGFKCDIEQYGTVVAINGSTLTLENKSGFRGNYIHGETHTKERSEDCWIG